VLASRSSIHRAMPTSAAKPSASCFFFQAEAGIRDGHVTGVQTCALPIWVGSCAFQQRTQSPEPPSRPVIGASQVAHNGTGAGGEIGRASCRERGEISVDDGTWKEKDAERKC